MALLIHNLNIPELMWSPGIHPNWASGVRELGANQGWGCVDTILILFSCPTEGSLHNQEPREVSLCLIMLNVSEIHQPWTKAAPALLPHQCRPAHFSAFPKEASIPFWFFISLEPRVCEQETITAHQTLRQILTTVCCELPHQLFANRCVDPMAYFSPTHSLHL